MILSLLAFGSGWLIGRARGGTWAGVVSARVNGTGWLVAGFTSMLVLAVIDPALPLVWALAGSLALGIFGLKNLQLTGMIVMLIGLFLNLVPLLANGAIPVSELALQSVGEVDNSGAVVIDGLRESTQTAEAFRAFGDLIPVPIVGAVVSLGDIIMLVALADIVTNLMLRSRQRTELDNAGVSYTADAPNPPAERVAILSPLHRKVLARPAHAAHRRPRRKTLPSDHVPEHAKQAEIDLRSNDTVIVLGGPTGYVEQPPPPTGAPADEPLTANEGSDPETSAEVSTGNTGNQFVDLTAPQAATADLRPIIDLTVSPTDEQLCEFLRRRALADAQLTEKRGNIRSQRRGRAPRGSAGVVDATR